MEEGERKGERKGERREGGKEGGREGGRAERGRAKETGMRARMPPTGDVAIDRSHEFGPAGCVVKPMT